MKRFTKKLTSILLASCLFLTSCSDANSDNIHISDLTASLFSTENTTKETTPTQEETTTPNDKANDDNVVINTNPDLDEFENYLDNYFKENVTQDTLTLHFTLKNPSELGISNYPVTLGTFTLDDIESSSDIDTDIANLSAFDYDSLSMREQLTYDILMSSLLLSKSAENISPYYSELLSPNLGVQSNLPILLAEYEFNSTKDIDDYITLCASADDYFECIMEFEKKKSSEGLFMNNYICDQVLEQCNTFIKDPDNNYMLEVFNDKIDNLSFLSDDEKISYKEKHLDVIINDFIPAYNIIIDGINSLYNTGTNDGGLCNFEQGKEYYEYLVAYNTGSSKSVDDIDDMLAEAYSNLTDELIALYYNNPNIFDEIDNINFELSDPNAILNDLQEKMLKDFPTPPNATYTIKHVHPSLSEFLSPAFYIIPTIDDTYNNSIYLNDDSLTDNLTLYTTLCHEGYPGHLYQNIYTATTNPHNIRSLLSFNGYSEGFASYVEMYAYEYSGIDSDCANLLRINQILTLIMYAKADIGVHYYGWSESDLASFLERSGFSGEYATDLYWYVISEPANYLRYTIGYLEFEELLSTISSELNEDFSLIDFHDAILKVGPCDFDTLEKYVRMYLCN